MAIKPIEIPCTTKGHGYGNRMYVCRYVLEKLFEDEWNDRDFVACLKKATRKSRRPRRDALKINVPANFVQKGIYAEYPTGRMDQNVLTAEADEFIHQRDLIGEYWAWVEYE
jgi:hypothetical protein